jgi:hypothetical protein
MASAAGQWNDDVVRRVAGRVQRDQLAVVRRNDLAVPQAAIAGRRGPARPAARELRRAGRVVRVVVCEEDRGGVGAVGRQDGIEVRDGCGARIDDGDRGAPPRGT